MTSHLKTRCPHCQRAFRVSTTQLEAANGMVRCGICLKAFDGREQLVVDPTAETDTNLPPESSPPLEQSQATSNFPPSNFLPSNGATSDLPPSNLPSSNWKDGDDFYIDDNFDLSLLGDAIPANTTEQDSNDIPHTDDAHLAPPADRPGPEPTLDNLTPEQGDGEPLDLKTDDMVRWQPEPATLIDQDISQPEGNGKKARQWPWAAGSVLALTTLCAQLIYFNSQAIDRQSPLWPLAENLCNTLGCLLAANSDRSRIVTRDLVIRTHPEVAGALVVDALIINTASFDQPYPPLALIFEDLQGDVVAHRTFTPAEYLGGEPSGAKMMVSGQPVKLEMDIVDPGKEAVSFSLSVPGK